MDSQEKTTTNMKTIFTWLPSGITVEKYALQLKAYQKQLYSAHIEAAKKLGIDPDNEEYFLHNLKAQHYDREVQSHGNMMERFNAAAADQHSWFEQILNSLQADNYDRATELLNTALTDFAKTRDRIVKEFKIVAKDCT